MGEESTFIPHQEFERKTDPDRAIKHLRELPIKDIGFLDIVSDLKDIKEKAGSLNEEEKEMARVALKKILITLPPWRRAADFVNQNLEDIAYTLEEQTILTQLRQEAEERRVQVEQETAGGVSPWLSRVKHNEQNAQNPVAVGFYQMPDGQIRTIFGQRYFQSKRQIEGTFLGGRSEDKEVNLLSTKFKAINNPELIKSKLFDLLPEDLRERFEKGEILITEGHDFYNFSDIEIENLSASTDVYAVTKHIENKISDAGNEKKYYLLYQSDYQSDETGRTGVLMTNENGKAQPVIITVGDKQFVLEIKGCGKKSGGFGQMHYRTGRNIITGGAEREQAINEFSRLSEITEENSPKAAASILFDNNGYQQGYILRLTPSTIRASYSSNEVYPNIDSPEQVIRILDIYAQELAQQVFGSNPKILDRSSHSENILLWGDGKHTFTDFSDHVTFSDGYYPHEEKGSGYMTPRRMLEYYVKMVEEIPGYQIDRDKNEFLEALKKVFAAQGHSISIDETEDYVDIAKRLWEGGVAYQVFSARRANNYRADGVIEEFKKSITDKYRKKELFLTSEELFIKKYEEGFQKMIVALDIFQKVGSVPEITNIRKLVESRDLLGLFKNLDKIYNAWQEGEHFSEDERDSIYQAISYFLGLKNTSIETLKRYLEHEQDVISSSQNSAPENEKMTIVEAEKEIKHKIQELETILNDPQDLFRRITDPTWVEGFVSLNYYRK